jgi:hypothetical protein
VPLTPRVEHSGIEATTVVPNPHAQLTVGIFKFDLDPCGLRVTKCVDESLPANSINLMLDGQVERPLLSDNSDPKFNVGWNCEFALNARKGLNQVQGDTVR